MFSRDLDACPGAGFHLLPVSLWTQPVPFFTSTYQVPSFPSGPSFTLKANTPPIFLTKLAPSCPVTTGMGEEGGGETNSMNELTKTLFTLSRNFDRHVIIIQEFLRLCIINSSILIMSNILPKHRFFDFHLIYLLLHD